MLHRSSKSTPSLYEAVGIIDNECFIKVSVKKIQSNYNTYLKQMCLILDGVGNISLEISFNLQLSTENLSKFGKSAKAPN